MQKVAVISANLWNFHADLQSSIIFLFEEIRKLLVDTSKNGERIPLFLKSTGANIIQFFVNFCNKLECLSLAGLFRLVVSNARSLTKCGAAE